MWGQQSVPFYSEVAYISSTWSRVVVCGEAALASAVDEEVGDILFVGRGRGRLAGGSLASRPSLSASRLAGPAMVSPPNPLSSLTELASSSHPLVWAMVDASSARSSSLARTLEFLAGVSCLRSPLPGSFVRAVLQPSSIYMSEIDTSEHQHGKQTSRLERPCDRRRMLRSLCSLKSASAVDLRFK